MSAWMGISRRGVLACAVSSAPLLFALLSGGVASAERGHRAAAAVHPAPPIAAQPAPIAAPQRVYMGWGVLSIPTYFQPTSGKYDLILHFHGGAQLQEENLEKTRINAVVVSVNLGISSGPYSDFFSAPHALDSALERTQKELDATGRAPGAHLGRLALTAWSAGFGAVGSILSDHQNLPRIDAVLLADGLHAAYLGYPGNYKIYSASLEKYATFANAAMRGEKLFAITHSSIPTDGYASTTETVGELLRVTACTRTPHHTQGPDGMREIYQFDRGSFHVKGFEGTTKEDHIDHIKEMHETLFPYLQARWGRPAI